MLDQVLWGVSGRWGGAVVPFWIVYALEGSCT